MLRGTTFNASSFIGISASLRDEMLTQNEAFSLNDAVCIDSEALYDININPDTSQPLRTLTAEVLKEYPRSQIYFFMP